MTLLAERRFMTALSGCPRRSQDYNQNLQTTFDFHDFLPEYEPTPFYREGLEGSEKRAREAARSDGFLLDSYRRPDEFYRLKYSMLEERLEQVREIDGELAYEKMRRAVEKASQEKARQARQVERARLERARQETARQSRERRGPERRGPERDFGPSR